jgi:hypothetical protein
MQKNKNMKIEYINTSDLIPYANNAKIHDEIQIEQIKQSIKSYGFNDPVAIWKNNEIIEGHGRVLAAKDLGIEQIPIIRLDNLSDKQRREYMLVHNQLTMNTGFDAELLDAELQELDFDEFDYGFETNNLSENDENNPYTAKVDIPHYAVTNEEITLNDCYNTDKTKELIEEIKTSNVSEDEKKFLIAAAKRHICFNYRNIAEYYAKANKEMQQLMEKSALVIIDYENAISNGYAKLYNELTLLRENTE